MIDEGFPDWRRAHFQSFIKSLEKYGRDSLDKVAADIDDHTEEEVRAYAAVFFVRYKELKGQLFGSLSTTCELIHPSDADKLIARVETGESKLREQQERIDSLHRKVKSYAFPMQELKVNYGQNKGKSYSEEEDRFLLVRMHHHGIDRDDCYELIKRDIGEWPLFRSASGSHQSEWG